jgi:hypothetical protein
MYCPLPTIHDDLETLRTRLRQTRDAEQKQRLYLLVLKAHRSIYAWIPPPSLPSETRPFVAPRNRNSW